MARSLISAECSEKTVSLRGSLDEKPNKKALATIRSLTKKDQFHPVDVVIKGTFRVAHGGQCFGEDCWGYELEEHQLLCAQPPNSNSDTNDKSGSGR
jgi:hypothetical protein